MRICIIIIFFYKFKIAAGSEKPFLAHNNYYKSELRLKITTKNSQSH